MPPGGLRVSEILEFDTERSGVGVNVEPRERWANRSGGCAHLFKHAHNSLKICRSIDGGAASTSTR